MNAIAISNLTIEKLNDSLEKIIKIIEKKGKIIDIKFSTTTLGENQDFATRTEYSALIIYEANKDE